jgi:hypothetical protein
MGQLIIVENDKVAGIDRHRVIGNALGPPPPPPYSGIGDYDYRGRMTDQLSAFVSVNGRPVALKSSSSSLHPGEDLPPTGRHSPGGAETYTPDSPAPNPLTINFTAPVGTGHPSSTSGSTFVKVDGVAILLDGDKIDTCGGEPGSGNSTVSAEHQDFVSCSE